MWDYEAFCVVTGASAQGGETLGQIIKDLLRLVFYGPMPYNALWDGTLTRSLDMLVAPKKKRTTTYIYQYSKGSLFSLQS